jgi:diguanylate cyclase (GGDEF)-like protein
MLIAERIRRQIEEMRVPSDHGELAVTISIGVCASADSSDNPEELIKKADTALYQSKEAGRNRVTSA